MRSLNMLSCSLNSLNHALEPMLSQYAKNIYVNITAMAGTAGLSIVNMISALEGVLPTISLLVTTLATFALGCYHVHRISSERKINKLKVEQLKREIEKFDR